MPPTTIRMSILQDKKKLVFIPAPLGGRLWFLEVFFCYNFARTIFRIFIHVMTVIVISQNYANPLPHSKRVCEGLGGCDTT